MAAPTFEPAQLPAETGNTGKLIRLLKRLVAGPANWYDHVYVPVSRHDKLGIWHYSPAAVQSVQATAHNGTATGFWWLQNPTDSTKDLVLRELALALTNSAATVAASAPRIVLSRFTFASAASGANVTGSKRRTTGSPTDPGYLRTVPDGMTGVALVATVASFVVPVVMTAVGELISEQRWPGTKDAVEDDGLHLEPGEGAVLWQADAGTTTDPRRFAYNLTVEAIDRPA